MAHVWVHADMPAVSRTSDPAVRRRLQGPRLGAPITTERGTGRDGGDASYEALARRLVHRDLVLGSGDRIGRSREDDAPNHLAHRAGGATPRPKHTTATTLHADDNERCAHNDDPDDGEPPDDRPAARNDADHRDPPTPTTTPTVVATVCVGTPMLSGQADINAKPAGDDVLFVRDTQLDAHPEVR